MNETGPGLPRIYSVAEVAAALRETEHYVTKRARKGHWPCLRGARNSIRFTQAQVDEVIRIQTHEADPAAAASKTPFLTPGSQRALQKRRAS